MSNRFAHSDPCAPLGEIMTLPASQGILPSTQQAGYDDEATQQQDSECSGFEENRCWGRLLASTGVGEESHVDHALTKVTFDTFSMAPPSFSVLCLP